MTFRPTRRLALTAVTDNAALTYLGSQIEGISASAQYMLVAGAVAGLRCVVELLDPDGRVTATRDLPADAARTTIEVPSGRRRRLVYETFFSPAFTRARPPA
mgnify:CR=1 FL=1